MSRGEGDSRTRFVADELDALGKIDGLAGAPQRLRDLGPVCAGLPVGWTAVRNLR